MRILFISSFDFSTHKGGGATYTRCLIDLMSGPPLSAQVDHVWPDRNLSGRRLVQFRLCQIYFIFKSLFSRLPAQVLFARFGLLFPGLKSRLADTAYDLIIISRSDILWLLGELPPHIPVALVSHNIEHQIYDAWVESLSPLLRPLMPLFRRDAEKFQRYEIEGFRQFSDIISISVTDSDFIRALNPEANILDVPPGFSYPPFRRRAPREAGDILNVGFMAKFDWWPNKEGIVWFVDNVLPSLDGRVRLHLFGQDSHKVVDPNRHVVAHGFVEDIADIWAACDFMICPIFSGSGVNVKFAEGLYNAMPVLATPFAARGLNIPDEPSIVMLGQAGEWIDFLRSPAATQLASMAGSEDIARSFAVDAYREPIKDFIESAVGSDRQQRS